MSYSEEQFARRVARLAKWAQREIERWKREAEQYRARLEEIESTFPDSNVKVSQMRPYEDQGLPLDSEIDFYLGDERRKYQDMITVQHLRTKDRKVLRVSGSGNSLIVKPSASNTIEITLEGLS